MLDLVHPQYFWLGSSLTDLHLRDSPDRGKHRAEARRGDPGAEQRGGAGQVHAIGDLAHVVPSGGRKAQENQPL